MCISVLIRNKEHSLPYFFGAIEGLDYPKEKIALYLVVDHSVDESQEVIEKWLPRVRDLYLQIRYEASPQPRLSDRGKQHHRPRLLEQVAAGSIKLHVIGQAQRRVGGLGAAKGGQHLGDGALELRHVHKYMVRVFPHHDGLLRCERRLQECCWLF